MPSQWSLKGNAGIVSMLIMRHNSQRLTTDREPTFTGDMHLTTQDLSAFLVQIQDQNETAFSQFYDYTVSKVYGLALHITANVEAAEEVVSDVYLQVWQQADRYQKEKASVMTWLLTLSRSRAIDYCRKRQQTRLEVDDSQLSETISLVTSPEHILINTQQQSLIHQALQKLSSVQRQLLALAFFRGLTYQEIADAIDMPLATVKSHMRRGLIKLKAEASLNFSYATDWEHDHG